MISLKTLLKLCTFPFGFLSVAHADERPNILIIYVDDLGYNDIGCFSFPADPALKSEPPAPYPETSAYAAPNQATALRLRAHRPFTHSTQVYAREL